MSKNDGGPAFPVPMYQDPHGDYHGGDCGISAREYFAAHAPIAITDLGEASVAYCAKLLGISEDEYNLDAFGNYCKLIAKRSFIYADAMIAERSK